MSNERITIGPLMLFGTQSGVIVSVIVRSLRDFYIGTLTATIDEWQSLRALAGTLGAGEQRHAEDARLLARLRQTITDVRRVLVEDPLETLLDAAVRCVRQRDAARRDAEELRAERDALKREVDAARRDAEELRVERDALKREVDDARVLRALLAAVMKARDEACDIAAEGLHVFSPSHLNPDAVRTRLAKLRKVGKESSDR